ncbi:hypothetical protein A6A04_18650 [Paramagnetospirillum marisnigri]|uniref:Uncharacterized protein n=1 Tax=Paramagnetospirillum marisnigri TaxID=1285242 RepID=A0A178MPI8_9PROT|nr:hypothetical protein [Paramagnetospirillum marisnigri]OAN49864.1 hypothetical protein A6A04_18650 [Paramagnetospirillum marisnigri]
MAKTAPAGAKPAAKPVDKDAAFRREIVTTIKGPVTEKLTKLIPALAAFPDPYTSVLATPDLLFACMQLIKTKRELFAEFLVDAAGNPVADDETPLRCERSVNQIIGMVVRSGAKAYAAKRFAPPPEAAAAKAPAKAEPRNLLEKITALVSGKWGDMEVPKPSPTQADIFYNAITDYLDYDWQVPLIPYFAELPVKLIREMGRGVTTLHTPEGIAALADIGRQSMDQAKRILSDDMMREMLDTQPLAAKGVAFLGKDRYDYLHGTVYEKMGEKFWEMCVDCERLEAMEVQNAKDLEQMASHLHILSGESINQMVRFLQFSQIPIMLEVGTEKLGEEKFAEIFGVPGNKKLIKMFCEKIKVAKLDSDDPDEDLRKKLPDIFNAYLRAPADFERGM